MDIKHNHADCIFMLFYKSDENFEIRIKFIRFIAN